jgi:hypothetical protein
MQAIRARALQGLTRFFSAARPAPDARPSLGMLMHDLANPQPWGALPGVPESEFTQQLRSEVKVPEAPPKRKYEPWRPVGWKPAPDAQ